MTDTLPSDLKKCPYCAEDIKAEAIVCRFCGRDLNPPAPAPPTPAPKKEKSNLSAYLVLAIFFVCLIMFIISTMRGGSSSSSAPDEFDACVMAQQFVKENLRAPSTAEFPACSQTTISYKGDNRWSVIGYVDAENGFGAMLRTRYNAQLLYLGDDRWRLEEFDFIE